MKGIKLKYLKTIMLAIGIMTMLSKPSNADIGEFENDTDIGQISLQGSAQFDSETKQYRISGSGENMWASQDAFHFLWRRVSGDLKLTTNVTFTDSDGHEHRKAGWMVRQSLAPDAAYVDVVVHGNGLISMQYRSQKGGVTQEIQASAKGPATLLLERDGHQFTLSLIQTDGSFQPVGTITVQLKEPVYAGLAVCSHDAARRETAVFSKVGFERTGVFEDSRRILESTLEMIDIKTGRRRIIHRVKDHIEAPNWAHDGQNLVFNSHGKLYSIKVTGDTPRLIETGMANKCNNDHGFSPDGKWIALSHNTPDKGSLIYVIPAAGGEPRLVTTQGPSYWHGWSPDGTTLTYCAERDGEFDVYTIPVKGGNEKRLTEAPGLDDGPEYSPDGRYIYFNSVRSGSMKIWRMKPDGRQQQQVTFNDEYNDWFAHPSPDGKWLVFLSYDKSVEGHPANKQVTLRIMPAAGGQPRILTHLFGGQGTINVPSWSPDSKMVAFVSYRMVADRDNTR
jgi:TolB protein